MKLRPFSGKGALSSGSRLCQKCVIRVAVRFLSPPKVARRTATVNSASKKRYSIRHAAAVEVARFY